MGYQHTPSTVGRASRHQVVSVMQQLFLEVNLSSIVDLGWDPKDKCYTCWIKNPLGDVFITVGTTPARAAENMKLLYPELFRN